MDRFRAKARQFLKANLSHIAVLKLHRNQPLTKTDVAELERIFAEAGVGSPHPPHQTRPVATRIEDHNTENMPTAPALIAAIRKPRLRAGCASISTILGRTRIMPGASPSNRIDAAVITYSHSHADVINAQTGSKNVGKGEAAIIIAYIVGGNRKIDPMLNEAKIVTNLPTCHVFIENIQNHRLSAMAKPLANMISVVAASNMINPGVDVIVVTRLKFLSITLVLNKDK
jgi:hypothetical protein